LIDLDTNNFDLDLTGFSKDLIIFPEEKDNEVPNIPEKAKSKYGDIYILGKHRLLCGDATKKEDVEKLMNGEKADMVFTDPPYLMSFEGGMGEGGTKGRKDNQFDILKNDNLNKEDGDKFLIDFCKNIKLFCKGS
jgi:DNA modification methylase